MHLWKLDAQAYAGIDIASHPNGRFAIWLRVQKINELILKANLITNMFQAWFLCQIWPTSNYLFAEFIAAESIIEDSACNEPTFP